MGWEVLDGDNHTSHDYVSNMIVRETHDDKDMHPCLASGEDGQLVVALA